MKKTFVVLCVAALGMATAAGSSVHAMPLRNSGGGMIERHDLDGDGKISRDEFPGPDEHFDLLDVNGDGFLDEEESSVDLRPESMEWPVPQPFYEDDVDGDGKVSRSEFTGPADHFDRFDLNGDGYIDQDEARRHPPGPPPAR